MAPNNLCNIIIFPTMEVNGCCQLSGYQHFFNYVTLDHATNFENLNIEKTTFKAVYLCS